MTHFGAMLDQFVRQNQTLISFIDRVVVVQHETTLDLRGYRRTPEKAIEDLGLRFETRLALVREQIAELRCEMNERFKAVGVRFDVLETKTDRIANELRQDMLRLGNGVLSAQQSALQAHLRLDQSGSNLEDPPAL